VLAEAWPAAPANGSTVRLVRRISLLWASYMPIFYAIDSVSVALRTDVQALPVSYYLCHSLPPLSILGLSLWARGRLARWLLPLLLVMLAVMPLAITPLVLGPPRPGPLVASSGLLVIRMLPLLYTALVLIAWHYRWPHVVAFSVGTGLLSAAPGLLWGSLLIPIVALIHTLAFLGSGYAIGLIAERLRLQSQALAQANSQLRHYASALERLTTTRERNRMARELHDTLAHTLTALAVQMETAKAYTCVDAEITRQLLERGLPGRR
jgi:signal transduction histidine kinase